MTTKQLSETYGVKVNRLYAGMYKITTPSGLIYFVEDVTRDVELGRGRQWNISPQKVTTEGVLLRDAPCDAAPTLHDAVAMVGNWCERGSI
jgi:hypothetical protein